MPIYLGRYHNIQGDFARMELIHYASDVLTLRFPPVGQICGIVCDIRLSLKKKKGNHALLLI